MDVAPPSTDAAPGRAPVTLTARGLALGYGTTRVLAGVDLELRRGDFVGILGPNGAGKSTLFRGLLGLLAPLAGTIDDHGSALGYVPQESHVDASWPVSAFEVVRLGARRQGLAGRAERHRQALEQLDRVGLADRARQRFTDLSGGQRQRVLMARALMSGPDVLVLDEPTSGVDLPSQERILATLAELNAETGMTILLVAHQLELVTRTAGRFLWVAGGAVHEVPAAQLPELFGSCGHAGGHGEPPVPGADPEDTTSGGARG